MTKDAKPDTWMPLVIGDYLKKTGRLTTEQHGAYLLLLMSYWMEGPPQDDDEDLASITRLDRKTWLKHRRKLVTFFEIVEGRWRNDRADEELALAAKNKASHSDRGRAGADARWGKRPHPDGPTNGSADATAIGKSKARAKLKECPPSIPREVDAHKGQSTLSGRDAPEARRDGASEPPDTERGWLIAASEASTDLLRCKRSDPDRASELEEFIASANARAAELRRQRLTVAA